MKKVFIFLIVGLFLFGLVLASEESLWSENNSVSAGMDSLTNSANADGSTTGNYAVASDSRWGGNQEIWTFIMNNSIVSTGIINSVFLYFKHYQSGHNDDDLNLEVYDGNSWQIIQAYNAISPPTSDTTNSWNVSSIFDSWTKLNESQFRIIGIAKSGRHDSITWYVDTVELRINYTEVFSDTCTYSGSGNWEIDCADNCTISSDVNLLGNNISIIGSGSFSTTANISNFDSLHIAGTDAVNRCNVYCSGGGCFI